MIQFGGFARDVVAGFGALHPETTGLASRVFSFVDVMPQQIPGSTRTSRSHPSVFSAPHRTAPPTRSRVRAGRVVRCSFVACRGCWWSLGCRVGWLFVVDWCA